MKNKRKQLFLWINLIAVLSVLAVAVNQIATGAMEKTINHTQLSLSSSEDLTSLKTGEGFQVIISKNSDVRSTADSSDDSPVQTGDSDDALSSKSHQWTMVLPEGISFDEATEKKNLQDFDEPKPNFNYEEKTRQLTISVDSSIKEVPIFLIADQEGSYELCVSDANLDNVKSKKTEVLVNDREPSLDKLQSERSGLSISPMAENTAVVSTWDEFVTALGTQSITQITLAGDITASNKTNVAGVFTETDASVGTNDSIPAALRGYDPTSYEYFYVQKDVSRSLVIEGQGNTFDFNNVAIGFADSSDTSGASNGYWNIKMQNIHVESTNPYAPFYYPKLRYAGEHGLTSTGLSQARLTYGNSTSATDLNGSDYTHTKYVKDMGEFFIAYANRSVTKIQLVDDIVFPSGSGTRIDYQLPRLADNAATNVFTDTTKTNDSNGAVFVYTQITGAARAVTIDGEKAGGKRYTMDFGAITLCVSANNNTLEDYSGSDNLRWYQTIQNINFYHGNYWGPIEIQDLSDQYEKDCWQRFVNVTDYGAQFLQAQSSVLYLAGDIHLEQREYYQAVDSDGQPLRTDGINYASSTDSSYWRSNDIRNQTLGVWSTTIEDNANVTLSSLGGPVLDLYEGGSGLEIGENVTLNATRGGNATSGDGNGAVFSLRGGSVSVGKGSVVNLTSTNTSSQNGVLSLNSNSAAIDIEEGAEVNLYRTNSTNGGNGNTSNPIYMNSGGSINVNGSLNIYGTGMGNSSTDMIYSSSSVNFVIGENGSLDVQSDSTNRDQYLLRFGSGSTFKFADAKRVNLQRTNTLSGGSDTNNGLIYYSGELDVSVQNVYQWTLNNMSIGNDGDIDGGFTFEYAPMSKMLINYSNYTTSITSANSMYSATLDSFYKNFTTRGQQRVLFTQIPNPNVSIQNEPNDNPDMEDSYIVKGYARPGSYIRLWEEPLNGTTSAKSIGTGDTVLSPVEDPTMAEITRLNYTFKVPETSDGNWSINLKDLGINETFTAENIIHVYAFYNLKEEEVTKVVLDKTPPEGTGLTYYSYIGDALPEASDFVDIDSVTDTNPLMQIFTYEYVDRDSVETALSEGTSDTGIPVQIYVYDNAMNQGIINATLIVYDSQTGISADSPLEFSYVDIREMTDAELSSYILNHSDVSAYSIVNGVKTEWTDPTDFVVTDLGGLAGLTGITPNVNYPVEITLPTTVSGLSAALSTSINVRIINMNSILTVEFVNEGGTVLSGYTLTAGEADINDIVTDIYVGDVVNLKSTTYQLVQDQLAALELAGYEITTRPPDEEALNITNVTQTVQYIVTGQVFLESSPTTLDFGSIDYTAERQRINAPSKVGDDLVVADTRADITTGWTLQVAIKEEMKNSGTGSIMTEALRYVRGDNDEITLNGGNQNVYVSTTGGRLNVTGTWGPEENDLGLKLEVNPSKVSGSQLGTFSGIVKWTIIPGQP
ncbi:pectate lyase-like adhesive domain-containing protein [Enterococcus sp. HY326]|uniref:pectate lyase-like adhesive domain-containing protein n=1 Tax=Enterococcus sp. HY326 TaxID=2971265 RepID=UPI002ACDBEF1|nr:pectate lyase-like adhesive domain-containing protein [Enterococcus sp. HY326]